MISGERRLFFLMILVELLTIIMIIGAVVAVIVWQLDLQLPMKSVPITTDGVGSTPVQDGVYNIM